MSASPISSGAGVTGVSIGSGVSGADIIAFVEMLLLQDYDSQLADAAKKIRANLAIKQKYREKIAWLEEIKNTTREGGENTIPVGPDAAAELRKKVIYRINPQGEVEEQTVEISPLPWVRQPGDDGASLNRGLLDVSVVEAKINDYKMKLDSIDEQSELMTLDLQRLVSKRQVALEAITNIIKKDSEAKEAVVRNIA